MIIDVAGRVRNLNLKVRERLIPLFEAVVNAIQAHTNSASIEIIAVRDTLQSGIDQAQQSCEKINSFIITDYGVGFTDENLTSFKTSDSSYKFALGCKGIGRFTWLKVFDSVSIESVYKDQRKFKQVDFDFSLEEDNIHNLRFTKADTAKYSYTKVTLKDAHELYKEKFPIQLEGVATEIVQHCITYFLDKKIKSFLLKDNVGNNINLLAIFEGEYLQDIFKSTFSLADYAFKVSYVKNIKNQKKHKAILCANHRPVKEYYLDKFMTYNLPDFFIDNEGNKFCYSIYVMSDYLDSNVNTERTNFFIPERKDCLDDQILSIETIINEVLTHCNKDFSECLENMCNENLVRIEEYINHNACEYKPLLKHKPDLIKTIKYGLSDDELNIELHKILRGFECELKNEASKIKSQLKESKVISSGQYKDAYQKYVTALNDIGKSNLAKYVVHRKAILDIFDLSLELQHTDQYALERVVHDIVFPMNVTSEDVTQLSQNLWLIDERMAYHTFLASDQMLKKSTNIPSNERPDILIFNNPVIFSDDARKPSTATIVEFKRPMRDNYSDEQNPEKQVIGYVKKLRKHNELKNNKGRDVHLDQNLPVYCYIICDLSKTIREFCADADYTQLPDNEGYMKFHRKYNAYIEILSFNKISIDARKRNNVLFKELHLQ